MSSAKKLAELSYRSFDLPSAGNNVPFENDFNEPYSGPKIASNESDLHKDFRYEMVIGSRFGGFGVLSPNSIWIPEPHINRKILDLQSGPASQAVPLRSSSSQDDSIGVVFHPDFRCNGCGIYPITGPRFKSKVKSDYDGLCGTCFSAVGNGTDYIRVDCPAIHGNHVSFKKQAPEQPTVLYKLCAFKPDSSFVMDVNVTDGSLVGPLTPFMKIWRIRNNGMVVWPRKTMLVWISGDRLSNQFSGELQTIPVRGLAPAQELDIALDCISPERPGQHVSY